MKRLDSSQEFSKDNAEVTEKAFSGYHVYNVPFKVNIPKKSQKQISMFNIETTHWEIANTLYLPEYVNGEQYFKFQQTLQFENKEENNLGKPFPEGLFRVYKTDENNKTFFIGENSIQNTAVNDKLNITIGKNFDTIFKTSITDKKVNTKDFQYMKQNYFIENPSNEKQKYIIKQRNPIFNSLNKDLNIETNCNTDICQLKKLNKDYYEYTIILDKKKKLEFETTFKNF